MYINEQKMAQNVKLFMKSGPTAAQMRMAEREMSLYKIFIIILIRGTYCRLRFQQCNAHKPN